MSLLQSKTLMQNKIHRKDVENLFYKFKGGQKKSRETNSSKVKLKFLSNEFLKWDSLLSIENHFISFNLLISPKIYHHWTNKYQLISHWFVFSEIFSQPQMLYDWIIEFNANFQGSKQENVFLLSVSFNAKLLLSSLPLDLTSW